MSTYTNLPSSISPNSDNTTVQAFDAYYTKPLEVPVSTYNAVKGFFQQRGFDQLSSEAVAIALIRQSKVENVNVMEMLDTMQGLENVQISNLVSEVLNYNRVKTSYLGYAYQNQPVDAVKRNVMA